jgi:D-alanyl-D-alanine carboxypeptidase/D-alanyl-D-alanine-endopeptidase (penicillin-binding protein 4)
MGRLRLASWLAFGILWLGPLEAPADALSDRLGRALEAPSLRGARIAALVVDEGGGVVFARDPDRALIPASNQKVLTALAALHTLGPTHRFETLLHATEPPNVRGEIGTLYVVGGGDPALTSEEMWRLAADLRRAGVTRIRGGLVLDDFRFDTQRWHPSWGKTGARAYHAPIGALTVNYGAFTVDVTAGGGSGEAVRVSVDPPVPYLALTNRARTGPQRSKMTLRVDRERAGDAERVLVSGSVHAGRRSKEFYRSVLDPARYAGSVLRLQLESVGVRVDGEIRRGRIPEGTIQLVRFEGRALSEVVSRFMKYSNNQIGETLVKGLGHHRTGETGTWPNGLVALREALGELGLPLDGAELRDGSGLSYENRVTPRLFVEALRAAEQNFRLGPEFRASLPIAARDGTLADRADGSEDRVRAKTGLLTRVTALSGYAERPDGTRVIFSVLVNGFRRGADAAMRGVDGFVAALVE